MRRNKGSNKMAETGVADFNEQFMEVNSIPEREKGRVFQANFLCCMRFIRIQKIHELQKGCIK